MRKVIADEWMTLDRVVQAPSYAGEDASGGFGHGGWHARYLDELSMSWVTGQGRRQLAACRTISALDMAVPAARRLDSRG